MVYLASAKFFQNTIKPPHVSTYSADGQIAIVPTRIVGFEKLSAAQNPRLTRMRQRHFVGKKASQRIRFYFRRQELPGSTFWTVPKGSLGERVLRPKNSPKKGLGVGRLTYESHA